MTGIALNISSANPVTIFLIPSPVSLHDDPQVAGNTSAGTFTTCRARSQKLRKFWLAARIAAMAVDLGLSVEPGGQLHGAPIARIKSIYALLLAAPRCATTVKEKAETSV